MLHGNLSEFEEAEYCFRKIIEIHYDDAEAWQMRGKVFKYLNDEILSEACLLRADILKNSFSGSIKNKHVKNTKNEKTGNNVIKTPYGDIENNDDSKINLFEELSRTENSRIKNAEEKLISRMDDIDKERACKWSVYFRTLIERGSNDDI